MKNITITQKYKNNQKISETGKNIEKHKNTCHIKNIENIKKYQKHKKHWKYRSRLGRMGKPLATRTRTHPKPV